MGKLFHIAAVCCCLTGSLSASAAAARSAETAALKEQTMYAFPSPDPKRPLMIIRFSLGHEKPELWKKMLPVIKANRACFDEVWFSTGCAFPPLEAHRRFSRDMAAAAADLRKLGVIPSLQIQSTIGHSDSMGDVAAKTWGGFVDKSGVQCKNVSCPRQPGFLEYFRQVSRIYAQWKPGSVWIDDDLRLGNHYPAMGGDGCYCPDCLAAFSKEEGKNYTRETLISACDRDPELAQRWFDFGSRSLCGIAQVIAEEFHRCSPETRIALQHCDEASRNGIFRTMKEYSGMRSGSRPGGGGYTDALPLDLLLKGVRLSLQMASQPGYEVLGQICAEIENCPRVFSCKTQQGLQLESLFYLALGMDSLSYYVLSPALETPEWYGENVLAPLAADAPVYKEYIRFNEHSVPCGIGVCGYSRQFIDETGLPLLGVPFSGGSPWSSAYVITLTCAQNTSLAELKKFLAGNVIISGDAAMELEKRGLGAYLGGARAEKLETAISGNFFTGHPLCRGFEGGMIPLFEAARFVFRYPQEDPAFQALTSYRDKAGRDLAADTVLFTRPDGSRVALIGRGWGFGMHFLSSSLVTLQNRIADWVSHETLPVRSAKPAQLVIVPRITAEGKLRCVTVVNPTIGVQKEIVLLLRNVPENVKTATWFSPGSEPVTLPLQRENDSKRLVLPQLVAWEIGFAEFGN